MPEGETGLAEWDRACSSLGQGNYAVTVLVCQVLAEHVLVAHMAGSINADEISICISFHGPTI